MLDEHIIHICVCSLILTTLSDIYTDKKRNSYKKMRTVNVSFMRTLSLSWGKKQQVKFKKTSVVYLIVAQPAKKNYRLHEGRKHSR